MRSVHTKTGERLKFKCELCDKVYTRRDNLKTHMRTHHGAASVKRNGRLEAEIEHDEDNDELALGEEANDFDDDQSFC